MSAVRAVIFDSESRLLMLRRAPLTSRGKQWNCPGGRIKKTPRESIELACRREVLEETGLTVAPLHIVQVFETQSYVLCSLLTPGVEVKLTPDESSAFKWVHPSELLTIGFIADLKQLRSVLKCLGFEIPLAKEFEANLGDLP